MTGFTQHEEKLGRLVAKAIELGTPKEAFGMLDGDTRSVGPRVTLQMNKLGQTVYVVNSTNGLTLGRTYAEAHNAIVRTHQSHKQLLTAEAR
jgi:hypothetical protein